MMSLTDAELRRELQKHHENIGPITDTTRDLYIRRLEKLRNEQISNQVTNSSPKVGKTSLKAKTSRIPTTRDRSESPVLRSTRNSRNCDNSSQNAIIGYSTDEDLADKNSRIKRTTKVDTPSNLRLARQDSRRSYTASKELEARSLTPVHRRVKALVNSRKSSSVSPKRRSASLPKSAETGRYSDDSDDASEQSSTDSCVDTESTKTNTTPSLAMNRSGDDSRLQKFRAEIEAWKREEEEKENHSFVTQRNLSFGRRSTVLQDIDQNHQTGENSRTYRNGIPNIASKIVTQASQPASSKLISADSKGNLFPKRSWTVNFSSFLPIGTCIFFIVLGLLYATMKYDPSLNSASRVDYSQEEDSANKSFQFVHMIHDHVASYAGKRECGSVGSDGGRLEVSQLFSDLSVLDEAKNEFISACKQLIDNADWGITFYDNGGKAITNSNEHLEAEYVDSAFPVLSGWCRFTRAVQKVFLRIIFTTAVGILIWLGLVYRRYRLEKQRVEREQMYTMVQKILDVLRRQYDASENNDGIKPFLPILHVRDMIIPPQDRKSMAKVWERAKQFLSASETRIRVENQTIQGEDYLVWRWIQAMSPAKRHTATSRVWQGEAFDIKQGPMICPTPCLKLRNVFDPAMEVSKNWIEQIQDSILEKCRGNNEILRICVEKDSKEGLVYMLCATNQAAGHAFLALHGAWFDGRLLTVKFIRLHRFHQRFPESVNQSRNPMRPTSDVPVSTIIAPQSSSAGVQQYENLYPTLPSE